MVFKLILALVFYLMQSSAGHSFSSVEAKACFDQGLHEVQAADFNLNRYIQEKLDTAVLREIVAWRAWKTHYADLSDQKKGRVDAEIATWIKESKRADKIEKSSVTPLRYLKPVGQAYEISGYYRIDGQREDFTLLIGPGCRVWDASWKNARLSWAIAASLK